jgi:hypothetical protein
MSMVRCPSGHFYDSDKHRTCPWCAVPEVDLGATRRVDVSTLPTAGDAGATVRISPGATEGGGTTIRVGAGGAPPSPWGSSSDEGHTVAIVRKKTGIDPVVGWLVCVKGPEKGRDYRIRSEKNAIGRSESMDICIVGDETISRSDQAFLVYDPKRRAFRIQAGTGRGLIYRNGEEVITSEVLSPYDVLEIGESEFLFVPFCGERFQWEKGEEA